MHVLDDYRRAEPARPQADPRSWEVPQDDRGRVTSRSRVALPGNGLLLVAALAAAAVNQGAYYRAAQWPVGILLLTALVAALRACPWSARDTRFWPVWACLALGGWVVIRAALAHDVSAAVPTLALLAGTLAIVTVARRTTDVDALATAVIAIGAVVALTGWVGVAWRISPWALQDQGLWRAATAITYANAAAALLAMLALVALGRLVSRPHPPLAAATVCLLLVGVGATLGRGGIVALLAGLAVLAGLLGVRALWRAALAPAIGSAIALAGLVPSMPANSPPRPLLAVMALARAVVCHNGKTKTLPQPAVEAHLRHGDTPGPCPSTP